MGFFKRLFGASDEEERLAGQNPVMASDDLDRIEDALKREDRGGQSARLMNRAGDLHMVKGDRQAALRSYGNAIDAYLKAGEYDNAMAVCRKIIRVIPEVIRTRRTLAWLCLGKGFLEIAREHIEAYVEASCDAGLEALAVQQLQLMAQYVERRDFREFLAKKLDGLDQPEAAKRVREGQASESVRASGWTPVVFAAMLTPEELRAAVDDGVEIKAPTTEGITDEFESFLFDYRSHESKPESAGDAAADVAESVDDADQAEVEARVGGEESEDKKGQRKKKTSKKKKAAGGEGAG